LARLDAFSKWYRKLSGLDFSTLLIPELAKKPKSLAGKRCETFSAQNLRILSRKLIATEVCSESTLDLINDTFPVILGINSIEEIRGTNLLDLMANFYKDREYLVKPRYTLANEVETIALLERHIGRQSLNTKYGLSYPETCAIPLEFVLLAIANSYYCGPFTGALHTLIPHRVTVSSFHNLKLEKLFKDNYFAFQYFWGGNKD